MNIRNLEIVQRLLSIYNLEKRGDAILAILILTGLLFNFTMARKLYLALRSNTVCTGNDTDGDGDGDADGKDDLATPARRQQRQKYRVKQS